MKVLIVDDEQFLIEIWEELFSILDCTVRTAQSGDAAVETLRREDFDIVITDVRMPGGDGFVVLNYLRDEAPRRIPTFVCSGYIDDEATVLGPYQIERIIRKPFSFGDELEFFRALQHA